MTSCKKCCAQCPGVLDFPKGEKTHECCLPKYVSGNLKISSLKKTITDYSKYKKKYEIGPESWDRVTSYDRFNVAKKLHADNLKHQPLPDKVDYDMIKKMKIEEPLHLPSLNERYQHGRRNNDRNPSRSKYQCGSVLGYKKPETKMDLAICWQTPVDPTYEPPRPTYIDGSEGGTAPAIFELIRHIPNSTGDRLRYNNRDNEFISEKNKETNRREDIVKKYQDECRTNSQRDESNGLHRCRCMSSRNIAKESSRERSRSQYSIRNAMTRSDKEKSDPRLIRSAVGIALGTESNDKTYRQSSQKVDVPRPKTPFARRSFSIETLAPPFSIVNGCRDTDYPEHRRLMTVYQQSYKNPLLRKYRDHLH